ncbi:LysR family transcriptional regulator [Verticiella sediminum]|nr:LysR family transcriptional regulator [Verticiella sediminum]
MSTSVRIPLTPQQLKAFVHLAEAASFRVAAARAHVSQPALSRTIQHIEAVVGARLFDRDTRSVALTAAGRELLPMARRIVAEFDDTFADLVQFVEGRGGRVVIGMLPSMGVHVLPRAIAEFRAAYPGVLFRLRGMSAAPLLAAVEAGEVDFAVGTQPPAGRYLTFTRLGLDEFVLVCREDDPLARERSAAWAVLRTRPLIAVSPSSSIRPLTDTAFAQAGLSITPAYECEGELSICGALVREGLGVMVVPRLATCLLGGGPIAAVPLRRPTVRRAVGIVERKGRSLSAAAQRFRDQLLRLPPQWLAG